MGTPKQSKVLTKLFVAYQKLMISPIAEVMSTQLTEYREVELVPT